MKSSFAKVFLTCALLSACSSNGVMPVQDSAKPSSSSAVLSLASAFKQTCLANYPNYEEAKVKAAFERSNANSALLVASPSKTCGVSSKSHTPAMGVPTKADVLALARVLQSRIGGTLEWKGSGGNRIGIKSPSFDITISVYPSQQSGLSFDIWN